MTITPEEIAALIRRLAAENEAAMSTIKGLISSSEKLEARVKELEGALRKIALTERRNMSPQNRMKLIYDTCFCVLGDQP